MIENRKNNDWFLFLLAIITFIVVLVVYICKFFTSPFSSDPGNWGQFGDYVGGVMNPLLSIIVLWTVIKTLRHSSEALDNAEKDRQDSAKQTKRQNTFDLNLRFQSEELNSQRLAINTFIEFSEQKNWDFDQIRISYAVSFPKLMLLMAFYEQLNLYRKAELLDEDLVKSFFESDFRQLRETFVKCKENTTKEQWNKLLQELVELADWIVDSKKGTS